MAIQGPPLRMLSLDGGGVRGLSSIMILRHIMKGVNELRALDDYLDPWQVFDIIGGTSTGGIIAVMLGRLRMSLDQCERAYLTLSEKIFTPKRSKRQFIGRAKDFLLANGRFDAEVLEAAMKECIGEFESTDALLKDPNSPCKVFVVTTRESNAALALIRSYNNTKRTAVLYDECKIWEACRATSAATTFFDPVQIGSRQQKFIDGAVRYNNPIQQVYNEAMDLDQSRETFILSIGTGSAPGKAFEGKLKDIVEAMKIIVTETEQKAQDFSDNHRNLVDDNMLFRFNVYHGLKEVGLEEYKEIPAMADATETYLDHLDTRKQLRTCVSKLSQILQQVQLPRPDDRTYMPPASSTSFNGYIPGQTPTLSTSPNNIQNPYHLGFLESCSRPTSFSTDHNVSFLPMSISHFPTSPGSRTTISSGGSYNPPPLDRTWSPAERITVNYEFIRAATKPKKHDTELLLAWSRLDKMRLLLDHDTVNTAMIELAGNEKHGKLRLKAMESIIQNCSPDLNYKDTKHQRTPLIGAIISGREDVVRLLLSNFASLDERDARYLRTPLIWAVLCDNEDIIQLLLTQRASPESRDGVSMRTPLAWAAANGMRKAIEALLANGQVQRHINAKDIDGRTAFDLAEGGKSTKIVDKLVRHGARRGINSDAPLPISQVLSELAA